MLYIHLIKTEDKIKTCMIYEIQVLMRDLFELYFLWTTKPLGFISSTTAALTNILRILDELYIFFKILFHAAIFYNLAQGFSHFLYCPPLMKQFLCYLLYPIRLFLLLNIVGTT